MLNQVKVNLGPRSYDIIIGSNILSNTAEYLDHLKFGKKILLVTNPTVLNLYGQKLISSFHEHNYNVTIADIPDGEEYKNLEQAQRLYNIAFSAGIDRSSQVVALGGGVIGDLAGFVASTYMRGIPFIQVPTTLLSQVDSSVGGKVAVNHPMGKNIIGTFYQPALVITDLDVLKSLPVRELRAGIAEIIKYGVIADSSFFLWLENNLDKLITINTQEMSFAIEQSCRIKARVVEKDETESGIRAILNFGHTVGHALESLTGYQVYRHGEAVAIGMVVASRLAEKMGLLEAVDRERIESLIIRAGLSVQIPDHLNNTQKLIKSFYRDKKVRSGKLTFVLPVKIGLAKIKENISEDYLKKHLN